MKLKCDRKKLYEAVQIVETVAASTTTQPILQDIKITAEGGVLELSATDLEVGIRYFVREGIEIFDSGSVVIPGVRFGNILKEWVEEEIELTVEENICHLRGRDSHFKLFGGDIEMFPTIPDFTGETKEPGEKPFVVRGEVLAEMIRKTVYAVATERVNQALTGVLLNVNENKIKMIATNGRRLAKIERELEVPVDVLGTGIIPVKGLNNLLRVVSVGSNNMVEIKLRETYLLAKVECAVVSCRLIEGQYPDVEEAIPKDNDKKLELEKERLLSTVKQASLLTSEEYNVVRLQLEPGKLILSSGAADLGEARIELKAPYTGQPFDIGFNPEFVIDALKVITKDRVTLELKQPNTAGIIRDEQGDIFLIMPINLQQE